MIRETGLRALSAFTATEYLDGLPVGARIAAARVDDAGRMELHLYQRRALNDGTRIWKQVGGRRRVSQSRTIVHDYDDLVVAWLPEDGDGDG